MSGKKKKGESKFGANILMNSEFKWPTARVLMAHNSRALKSNGVGQPTYLVATCAVVGPGERSFLSQVESLDLNLNLDLRFFSFGEARVSSLDQVALSPSI